MWQLAERQHGVVSRAQLLELGYGAEAIAHRLAVGRLHRVHRGIYAVGRPGLSRHGVWIAAAMSCGSEAVVSHGTAARLWRIRESEGPVVEVTVPLGVRRRRPGVRAFERTLPEAERMVHEGVPVTTIHRTLLDLAQVLRRGQLEAAINAADKLDLTSPELLRAALWRYHRTPFAQTRDRRRDQTHTRRGLTQLRFTHKQIRYERPWVQDTLADVARRLSSSA